MKILVVDKIATHIFPKMTNIGYVIDYQPDIIVADILKIINHYDALIFRSKLILDEQFFSQADKLQWVARAGSGIDNINEIAAEKRGIRIISAGKGNMNAVAEHALGMLMCMVNNIHNSWQEVTKFEWNREKNRGIELSNMTVGIIGFGKTGQSMANKLLALGSKVYFYDIKDINIHELKYVNKSNLHKLFKADSLSKIQSKCQAISIHVSLNETSIGMLNKKFFENCTQNPFIINTSRGDIVMLKDLIYALKKGKLQGVALDVLNNENINMLPKSEKSTYEELFNMKNVLLTPHIAGWTKESFRKISDCLLEKIIKEKILITK